MLTLFDYAERQRDAALSRIEHSAGPAFAARARQFILQELEACGCLTGEQMTDAALAAGIVPANGDYRSMGPVIMALSRDGLIEKCAVVARRKGHGSIGANLWRLKGD